MTSLSARWLRSSDDARRPIIASQSGGATLSFVHNWPRIFNLGDYLCSPRHYFEFECFPSATSGIDHLVIVGGGAFNDLGVGAASEVSAQRAIAWGIGRSIPFSSPYGGPETRPGVFDACGWRDNDIARVMGRFVPCPSVFSEIVEIPPGEETGLFLNANEAASGTDVDRSLARFGVAVVGSNALMEREFKELFARTRRVVTNSYHVAYWGLLSGRQIGLVGYSSKFTNLLEIMNVAMPVRGHRRGDREELQTAISWTLDGQHSAHVPDYRERREAFREANLEFVRDLLRQGLFRSIMPLENPSEGLAQRDNEVATHYRCVGGV
jgi:hypothetical protein